MARTYGCLPSQVLKHADTFDLMVLDVSVAHQEIEQAKREGKPMPKHLVSEEDLQAQFKKVTGRDGKVSSRRQTVSEGIKEVK